MQKIWTNKGSILIWSTFLSLIILLTFTNISSKINKNLRNNSLFNEELNIQNEINSKIKIWTSSTLLNNDKLIFEENNSYTWSLKTSETTEIKFNTNSTATINIINWWPIYFNTQTSSWIININKYINTFSWSIYLKNLWWYTKYNIASSNTFITKTKKYKILKTIWNKEIIVTSGEIKNF